MAMSSSQDYKALAAAPETQSWSSLRRAFVVGSAVFACLLTAGLVFGYSALFPDLLQHGVFHDDCGDEGLDGEQTCPRQLLALSGMFTLATSALNMAGMPTGALLDSIGPRLNAAFSAAMTGLGCVIFAFGGPGAGQYAYNAGFLLMAIFGPPVFVSTLSFAGLFPKRQGLITAALVGCFDASSVIFVGLHLVIGGGVSFSTTMAGYGAAPLLVAVVALLQWPRQTVEAPEDDNEGSELESNLSKQLSSAWGLDTLPMSTQMRSPVYLALVHTVSVNMICLNFFIATVNSQMQIVNPTTSASLAATFAWMLPAGGIVYIPVVGWITDRWGPMGGYTILLVLLLIFSALNALYASNGNDSVAYASFTVFALCRPLFYTLGAGMTGQFFGFANFGKLYGLLFTLAGFANLAVQPLRVLAENRGFGSANAVLLGLQLSTVALPLIVCSRKGKPPAMKAPTSALFVSPGIRADGVRRMSESH